MKYERAEEIVRSVVHARKKFGQQASPNVLQSDLLDALVVFYEGRPDESDETLRGQLTKANRQFAALNARYERLRQSVEAKD